MEEPFGFFLKASVTYWRPQWIGLIRRVSVYMHQAAENTLFMLILTVIGTFIGGISLYFSYVDHRRNVTPLPIQQSSPPGRPPSAQIPQARTDDDITNSELTVDGLLGINGTQEKSADFSISKKCRIEIFLPEGTGFTVGYGLFPYPYRDSKSQIASSLIGTQSKIRSLDLPAGKYTFVLKALRNTGYYSAQLKAHCG